MPINPTTLKALIDTQITDETVNFAITPAEVGGRMKDTIDYTTEQIAASELLANKSTNVATDGLSNTKYPSVKAVKDYADGIVVGLLDDRGNYDASSNLFPATGGSGGAGAVLKGDLWYISVTGTLGGVSVPVGASVRALVDTPAQTSTNWSILNVGLGFTPENVVNKSTNVTTDAASDTKYPSVKAIKDYVDANSGGVPQTSGTINLSATPQVLPFDINSCATQGGKAFLPTTTEIGKQVYVFAVQDNIEIRANSENTNFMFVKFQTFIPSVTLLNKQMYLFTYIGFGSGAGGTVGGYWLAEEIKSGIGYLESSFKVTQNGTSDPMMNNYYIDQIRISPSDNTNPLFRSFAFNRVAVGQYEFQILWLTGSSSAINITKLDMSVGDGNIKLTSSGNGSFGPYSYFQQNINVYNAAGSLSDNEFYTNFYIRLFS